LFYTYILFSKSVNKYYVGYTSNLNDRIAKHGTDRNKFTGHARDWKLVSKFQFNTKSEAIKFESKIKKRGIKRFLDSSIK